MVTLPSSRLSISKERKKPWHPPSGASFCVVMTPWDASPQAGNCTTMAIVTPSPIKASAVSSQPQRLSSMPCEVRGFVGGVWAVSSMAGACSLGGRRTGLVPNNFQHSNGFQ